MTGALPIQRWRIVMSGLAVALVLILILATTAGRGAASDFLAEFRGERFAAVSLSTDQIANVEQTMSEMQHLGTVSGIETAPESQVVAGVAAASQAVGFPVLEPDPATLPEGVGPSPAQVRVVPAHQVRFTVDLDQARAYYQSIGQNDVTLSERFDGASLIINTPPAVVLEYRNAAAPTSSPFGIGLLVGQAGTVTAGSEGGVTLDELRAFLLGLPGLSPETVEQLQEIDSWKTTLPVPIPVDQVNWERATIAGSPGLLLNDNTGLGSAAIWERDGRIYAVAGAMKARELKRVAASLH
ncbi:MAG TPA: hypothetical protein VFV93_13195 [Thermomicrobiales bacterium]|nr:hypothetical protein [Thermomicrobiales bacterium]